MPVSRRTRAAQTTPVEPSKTSLDWLRAHLQAMADEWGEPWLLLPGFDSPPGQSGPSCMTLPHGVPRSYATSRELKQAIEEFLPRCPDNSSAGS